MTTGLRYSTTREANAVSPLCVAGHDRAIAFLCWSASDARWRPFFKKKDPSLRLLLLDWVWRLYVLYVRSMSDWFAVYRHVLAFAVLCSLIR